MFSYFSQLETKNKFLFIILLFLVIGFFTQTIFKGLENSCDLMWQPTTLFWGGTNHYEYQYNTGDIFKGCQTGRYGHFLFIFLYPISFLDWESAKLFWVVINVVFSISIPIILCRSFEIPKNKTLLIIGIFLTCHPLRMTINFGQNSLMMFFFIMLPFLSETTKFNKLKAFLAGISYVKYSTGYVFFLNLLVEKKFKKLSYSLILVILSWIFYAFYTKSNLVETFIGPFKLIFYDNYIRTGDFYSIMNLYFFKEVNYINKFFQIFLVLVVNLYFLNRIKNINNNLAKLAVICFLPLISLPHSNYDYVLLLPILIFGFKYYNFEISKYCIYLVLYYFYLHRIIRHWVNNDMIYQSGMLLIFVIFIFLFINNVKKNNLIKS